VPIAGIVGVAPAWARSGPERSEASPGVNLTYGLGGVQAVSAISPSTNPK
jgi:hypothetical protein